MSQSSRPALWRVTSLAAAAAMLLVSGVAGSASAADASTAVSPPTSVTAAPRVATSLPDHIDEYVWVDSLKVNFRTGASPSADVVATAYRQSRVLATGRQQGGWREFQVRGVYGWAPVGYFTTSKPSVRPIRVTVTAGTLQMRFFPGVSSTVEKTLHKSDTAVFTGVERGGWWELKSGRTYSWAPKQYVSVGGFFSPSKAISVGKSQVGYREPSWRNNKYNSWVGGNEAWCGVFVSWVFDHAYYEAGVPRRHSFEAYYSDLRRAGVLDRTPRSSELRKGDVVLMDWGRNTGPSHTGIVDRVSGNTLWLVEGNTTDGTGDPGRGVFYRQRGMASVYAWYRPSEYALATWWN